jgi:GDPmannose 4,6-dehydratase
VTGLSGQDGSFLAELLLERGYDVIGMVRPEAGGSPGASLGASEHLRERVELLPGDLLDPPSLRAVVAAARPDELYHLAAPSFVPESWLRPARTLAAIAESTATLLEAVRKDSPETRVFVAGSGAIFGAAPESPQHEDTVCRPDNPYATAKLAARHIVGQLRAHDGVFACSGILYNHESERRSEQFVTRKITRAAAAIKLGLRDEVVLGDTTAVRDWSFAGDVMLGAWLMLQQDEPGDFVVATGIAHSVRDCVEIAFDQAGIKIDDHVVIDDALKRPAEVDHLVGDASNAKRTLGWEPRVSFEELIRLMVDADHDLLSGGSQSATAQLGRARSEAKPAADSR